MKQAYLLITCLLASAIAVSQKDIPLENLMYYGKIDVKNPVICDSIDVNGDNYSSADLLDTYLSLSNIRDYELVHSKKSSAFIFKKPKNGSQLSLLKFYLNPENFMPVQIDFKSSDPFIVYMDGVKEAEKKTKENNFKDSRTVTMSFNADPRQYSFTIKILSDASDLCDTYFSATLKTGKKDSLDDSAFSAKDRRILNITDFLVGKRISRTSVSPNGKYAIIDYNIVNDNGSKEKSTEVKEIISGRIILRDENSRRQLNWMPASNLMYYTSKHGKTNELKTIDPVTLQERVIAKDIPDDNFAWSPKEDFLIISKADTFPEDKGELHRLLSPEDRQAYFRDRSSLYKYDLSTGICNRLTYGKNDTWLCDISNNGKMLLFGVREPFVTKLPFNEISMFLLNLETMKVDTIWYKDGYATDARFSPDCREILLIGGPDAFGGIGRNIGKGQIANQFDIQAFIMDIKTKSIRPFTRDFDPSIAAAAWNRFDGKIYLKAEDKDYERLFVYDPGKKTFEKLPATPDVVNSFDIANNAPVMIYYGSTDTFTGKGYSMDLKSLKETVISDPGSERLAKTDIGKTGDWNFTAMDGTLIDGRYYLPPHFNPSARYPVIVYYYGGTSPKSREFESNFPLSLYAAMGYVVYTLQPSGATGFGQKFSARHVNAWGKYDADEIIQGTKLFCREHPFADSTRIGCIGASYGGFMTMYLLTKTNMFKAAVSHAGISSIASYWGEGYWGYSYGSAATTGNYPWNNPKLYTEQSPLFNADKINTPILLIQGKADTNVPIGESIQMYNALKILGKDVELIHVDAEDHHITNMRRKVEWQRTIFAYFAKYLKNDDRWWNDMYKPTAIEE